MQIAQLCATAVDLQRWGTTFDLQVQGLTRDEYDRFDGEDRHFPPTSERAHDFWSKKVTLYAGGFDHESERRAEGSVVLTLYTRFAPVEAHVPAGLSL